MEELTPKEKEQAEAIRKDEAKTKPNMRRLNRIYNRVTGETKVYCMCDKSERAIYYDFFYSWYDTKGNR